MAGLAVVIGAGVFVLTGTAAREYAGPAIIVSFAAAGVAALASALCYAEFASEVVTTGGAAFYAEATFGPLAGWLTAANLLLEYVLASAAVAKGFTAYLAALAGLPSDALLLSLGGAGGTAAVSLDLPAAGVLLALALLVGWGARQSATFNNAVTAAVLVTIALVLAAGFAFVQPGNYSPFAPFGARGVLRGASVVFFAYIGFDMVAVAAEESMRPARDVPCGILASLLASTAIYVLMATAVTGMVRAERLDPAAPFARAFKDAGQPWAQYVIAVGAICSVLDTLVVTLFSAARLLLLLGRESVLPHALAAVHPRTQTPLVATAVVAVVTCVLAALAPLATLASLVSLGTLMAFATVCAAVWWRRCSPPPPPGRPCCCLMAAQPAAGGAAAAASGSAADAAADGVPPTELMLAPGTTGGGNGAGLHGLMSSPCGMGDTSLPLVQRDADAAACSSPAGPDAAGVQQLQPPSQQRSCSSGNDVERDCGTPAAGETRTADGGHSGGSAQHQAAERAVGPNVLLLLQQVQPTSAGGSFTPTADERRRRARASPSTDAGEGTAVGVAAGGAAAASATAATRPQRVQGSNDSGHYHGQWPPPKRATSSTAPQLGTPPWTDYGGDRPPSLRLGRVRPVWLRVGLLAAVASAGVAVAVMFQTEVPLGALGGVLGAWAAVTAVAQVLLTPPVWVPPRFVTPLYPWVPSFGLLMVAVLLGSLEAAAWMAWGGVMGAALLWWACRALWRRWQARLPGSGV
ncbi:hypothetical protein HYH02_000656 [Chlamydomonas schloesseri]|uniref:Cationic amino acid transporter C-terminal domain-containing protein n=1 Tax=Chlamydomonas schloesseri TaxID=2026947 RepID=A0A836BDJ6_9CHLO|nr:hypothetical protein HYH02_000656 [Chlamydomonas schloesseri]|eukprot:KAG2454824.1 hypothetical protein HYH02_000656 [Chlamydomonas schloesseri]